MEKGQLTENPGGRPKSLPDDADVYEDLLKRLQPFRCALFEGQKAPKKTVLPPFTPAMLSWHDNPTSGMYIAVEGIIYNVTGMFFTHSVFLPVVFLPIPRCCERTPRPIAH